MHYNKKVIKSNTIGVYLWNNTQIISINKIEVTQYKT